MNAVAKIYVMALLYILAVITAEEISLRVDPGGLPPGMPHFAAYQEIINAVSHGKDRA
jgi:hypothetical protein